jgi:hypothetical protein
VRTKIAFWNIVKWHANNGTKRFYILLKGSLNSAGKQFHEYQHHEQPPLTSNHSITNNNNNNKKKKNDIYIYIFYLEIYPFTTSIRYKVIFTNDT